MFCPAGNVSQSAVDTHLWKKVGIIVPSSTIVTVLNFNISSTDKIIYLKGLSRHKIVGKRNIPNAGWHPGWKTSKTTFLALNSVFFEKKSQKQLFVKLTLILDVYQRQATKWSSFGPLKLLGIPAVILF